MNAITIEKRAPESKARALRRAGFVPCCIFGRQMDAAVNAQMKRGEAQRLRREKRTGGKVELLLEGKPISVLIRQMEIDSVSNEIQHLDFQMLPPQETVSAVTTIYLKNRELISGTVLQALFEIPYTARAEDMVESVTIDLAGLASGTQFTVRDIPELNNDKIQLQIAPESLVVRISDSHKSAPRQEE